MEKYGTIYKNRAETSLEALQRFRQRENIAASMPLTYAGTLDPMAEGLLLILIGDECKKKSVYTKLDKTYEVEILFGVSTDTGDLLGLISNMTESSSPEPIVTQELLDVFVGKKTKSYHPFSHKKVSGKPLFQHAKDGSLGEIEMPTKEIEIGNIELFGPREIAAERLEKEVLEDIARVRGDFRQNEIITSWQAFFKKAPEKFHLLKIVVTCSSGTYIRSLTEEIGEELKAPTLTYTLKRTRIGEYSL